MEEEIKTFYCKICGKDIPVDNMGRYHNTCERCCSFAEDTMPGIDYDDVDD